MIELSEKKPVGMEKLLRWQPCDGDINIPWKLIQPWINERSKHIHFLCSLSTHYFYRLLEVTAKLFGNCLKITHLRYLVCEVYSISRNRTIARDRDSRTLLL